MEPSDVVDDVAEAILCLEDDEVSAVVEERITDGLLLL